MKSDVLSEKQWDKLLRKLPNPHKTIMAICRYTACRSCEALGLRVEDVYGADGNPKSKITFPARIRKGGKRSLSVRVSDKLYSFLKLYDAPKEGYLFPSRYKKGEPISYRLLMYNLKRMC